MKKSDLPISLQDDIDKISVVSASDIHKELQRVTSLSRAEVKEVLENLALIAEKCLEKGWDMNLRNFFTITYKIRSYRTVRDENGKAKRDYTPTLQPHIKFSPKFIAQFKSLSDDEVNYRLRNNQRLKAKYEKTQYRNAQRAQRQPQQG